jgi:putative DNA methylase
MTQPKKLIEMAMPIREVSAESVRDKSIRHGHISTLHLWWARRPLPVCRAVVFASLVPDPLDEHCPKAFRDAVELLLGKKTNPGDPYKPYKNIPGTSALDPMDDNLRNRLLMFIGGFSEKYIANEEKGKKTDAKEMLSPFSLIKWESRNDAKIIGKARQLIWVAHNSKDGKGDNSETLIAEHNAHYAAITKAEEALYSTADRHLLSAKVQKLEAQLHAAIEAYLERMPTVFDPFAGGGAIPLEAARLGCRSYGNDLNPVAHIVQRGSLEFPQKYGKPITYSKAEYVKRYGKKAWDKQPQERRVVNKGEATAITIPNRLAHDVEHYAKLLLERAQKSVGHLYAADKKGRKPIAYYWARTGICSNPACRVEVPLLRQFYLCDKKDKRIHLKPRIENGEVHFELKHGAIEEEGWIARGNLKCPACGNTTENRLLKEQFNSNRSRTRLIALVYEGDTSGKEYEAVKEVIYDPPISDALLETLPQDLLPVTYSKAMAFCLWNFSKWGDLHNTRQATVLNELVNQFRQVDIPGEEEEYTRGVRTYLAILFDRLLARMTTFGLLNTKAETFEHPFGKSAIQMIFDYPEVDPFSGSGGSGSNQLEWILRYLESESGSFNSVTCQNSSSGDREQFAAKTITATVTDPPYYDAVAYADLSDLYYVWLKRMISDDYPLIFATPQTPKTEECTALKHHREENDVKAKQHFEHKLLQIFSAVEHQTSDVVSIMYAHQSTEAWTSLCDSILNASMNITGSWAIDTERSSAGLKKDSAFLASSVTVSARPLQRTGIGSFKVVRAAIEERVREEVELLYKLGFRGADLLTACFGQAVSEFGKYQRVEKDDGSEVTVAELLELARESAFNALLKGFAGDDYTKFSIGWLQLYGFREADFDDAAKFSRVGLTLNVQDLIAKHLFIQERNKFTLATSAQRTAADANLGKRANSPLIDGVHRAMKAYKGGNRGQLLKAVSECGPDGAHPFWRVLTSLAEVLPGGSEDLSLAKELLANKDNLLREARQVGQPSATQSQMGFEA